ncbi:MAG: two-component regulator propeller domain-containing protein [Bacteroidota bacterium]
MRVLLLVVAVAVSAQAQSSERPRRAPLRHAYLGVDDGLSHSRVNAIAQDAEGFLWFGTDDGLSRYDGTGFRIYRHDPDEPRSLPHSRVTALHVEDDGTLWVGTQQGLSRFDRRVGAFQRYRAAVDSAGHCNGLVVAIDRNPEGRLHVGTNASYLCELVEDGPQDSAGLARATLRQRGKLAPGNVACPFSIYDLRCSYPRPSTTFHGPLIVEAGPRHLGEAFSIGGDPGLGLWIERWKRGAWERFARWPASSIPVGTQVSIRLSDGIIWAATEGQGIAEIDLDNETVALLSLGPPGGGGVGPPVQVFALFRDRQGLVWVGTNQGLFRFGGTPSSFNWERRIEGDARALSDDRVNGMLVDRAGTLWVATNDGLNRRRAGEEGFEPLRTDLDGEHANAFWWPFEDRAGTLWLGTKRRGLMRLDRVTERFESIYIPPGLFPEELGIEAWSILPVRHLTEDQHGTLWISTSIGLFRRDPDGTLTSYLHDPSRQGGLPDPRVSIVHESSGGGRWIGTDGGLCRLVDEAPPGRFDCVRHRPDDPTSLGADVVWTITESAADPGALWVGTIGGGLCRFDLAAETCRRYTTSDGLPNNTVYGVLADDDGGLWMSTNGGLARLEIATETFTVFAATEGLRSDAFDFMSYHRADDGRLFFGGPRGFYAFHPDSLRASTYVPPVAITGVRTFDQARPGLPADGDTLRLAHNENFVSFEFAAFDFERPRQNQYRYRLIGVDEQWRTTMGERPEARYTDVPPGTYTFEVLGANHDGLYNPEAVRLTLDIVPAWWQAWWFRSGALLLATVSLGALGVGTVRRREAAWRREQAEAAEMQRRLAESRERERARIARELHDGPVQQLYRIGHDLDRLAHHEAQVAPPVQAARDALTGVASELRGVLSTLRPPLIEHLGVGAALGALVRQSRPHFPDADLHAEIEADGRQLSLDAQHALYRIAQEALANAAKHAEARAVLIRLSEEGPRVRLTVRDDGRGFAVPDRLVRFAREERYGLVGAAERVEQLGGRFAVESTPGHGTQVLVELDADQG